VLQKYPTATAEALQAAAAGDFTDTSVPTQTSKGFQQRASGRRDS